MRILIALTYYRPHYSGLTIYVERLAKALVRRGHQVTILTSRFDRSLPARENVDGIEIVRLDVALRISKGVIMPSIPWHAWRMIARADIVNVHLPQLDAALIASLARLRRKPVVMTYHCDLRLPQGLIHRIANLASTLANRVTAGASNVIVTNTRDYAENSAFLREYLGKIRVIPPAVELPDIDESTLNHFRQEHLIQADEPIIGMLARLATEKGVEYLVQAMPIILERFPKARVLYVGQYQEVLGEEAYAARLMPHIQHLGSHWKFLGVLPDEEVVAFFTVCDVTVLPSLNSTESFGMVQIESMSCGTPVVAADIPGVRQPVLQTGYGRIVPPGDARDLAEAIIAILEQPQPYQPIAPKLRRAYAPDEQAASYEEVFNSLAPETAVRSIRIKKSDPSN
jgi:glycosyltransferase involved in cell wall biosynthesis